MASRTDIERTDAKDLFERIQDSEAHRCEWPGCDWNSDNQELLAEYEALLESAFQDGVISGRIQAGEQVFE